MMKDLRLQQHALYILLARLRKTQFTLPETNIAHENPGIYKETWGFSWAMLVSGRVGVVKWAPQISWRCRLLNYQCWKGTCGLLMSVLGNFRWSWCNTILKEIQNKVVMSGEEHWGTDVIHGSFSLTREGLYCRIDLFRSYLFVVFEKSIDPEMCAAKD